MKIAYIVPGSGDTFYCENCLRDIMLIKALKKQGHDITTVPMYLPLFLDSPEKTDDTPVFFGGLNVYLQQKSGLFRKTPRWLDKVFDSGWVLRKIARQAGSTSASELGEMTLSMLRGMDGRQAKELARLTEWLRNSEKPDAIHISNALLSGIAGHLKKELGVPVICSLQDEHDWLDAMNPPYDTKCWEAIARHSKDIDAFIAVSDFYSGEFAQRIGLPPEKVHTVHIGVNPDEYSAAEPDGNVIGFLARMSYSLGLGVLIDAFILLRKRNTLKDLKLRAAGGAVGDDIAFIEEQRRKLSDAGCINDVEFLTDFHKESRNELLKSLSVMTVPVLNASAFGTYVLEAMASGVPVVQPDCGAFPELIKMTNGGIIYSPNTPESLADALESLLTDSERRKKLGAQGRKAVTKDFTTGKMASGIAKVYSGIVR